MKITQHRWAEHHDWAPALAPVQDGKQNIVFIFGSRSLMKQGEAIQHLRNYWKGASVVGCSTSGEIVGDEVIDGSLAATVVGFNHTRSRVASVRTTEAGSSYAVGQRLAGQLDDPSLRHVFVLSDGLGVNGSDLARGLADGVPAGVSITGGLSGDGADFAETWVVADDAAGPDLVAAVGLYGDRLRVGYGSLGGWKPFGPLRTITRAEGNVLYELDGRSALDLYKMYLGEHADRLPGSALLFPLAVTGAGGGQEVVRTVLAVDEGAGSMTFAGDIPQGGTARFMHTNINDLVDGATAAAESSVRGLSGRRPELALLVSCVGRKLVMKQRTEEEVEAVRDVFGAATTLAGFYSYGELCPFSHGEKCRLHNQTMTITAFAEV